jgi:uncharacterized protein YeaO (DUF488 family)
MKNSTVQVRRIYEEPRESDGVRVLVDRLWPRGVSKERAHLDDWCKQIAPSTELREWYAHVPDRFPEFTARYRAELEQPQQAAELQRLRDLSEKGPLTLLTATKDVDISEAAVIAQLLGGPLLRSDP